MSTPSTTEALPGQQSRPDAEQELKRGAIGLLGAAYARRPGAAEAARASGPDVV